MPKSLSPVSSVAAPANRDAPVPPPNPDGARFEADYLTVPEAAAFLRCSKSYLDKLRSTGGGREFVRLGVRKILYRRADLQNWARARRFDSTSQYKP